MKTLVAPIINDEELMKEIISFVDKTLDHMFLSPEQYNRERKRMLRQMKKICELSIKFPNPQSPTSPTPSTPDSGEGEKKIQAAAHCLKIDLKWADAMDDYSEYPSRIRDIINSSRKLIDALADIPQPTPEKDAIAFADLGLSEKLYARLKDVVPILKYLEVLPITIKLIEKTLSEYELFKQDKS